MSDWVFEKISSLPLVVTDYVANGSFASLKENVQYRYDKGYARLIRTKDFNSSWKGDAVYVDEKSYLFLTKSKISGTEVIISNVGDVGTVFTVPLNLLPATLGPNAILIRFNDNYDFRFYKYWFQSSFGQHDLNGIISGSAQPKFNKTSFKKLLIPVPSINVQRSIAEVLSSIDDKIDLLNRQNETLEAMAQTLFRQWFIEEADESWGEVELGELVSLPGGYSFKSSTYSAKGSFKVITIKAIQNGQFVVDSAEKVEDLPSNLQNHQKLQIGDALISLTGNVGRVCLVDEPNCLLNQRVSKILGSNASRTIWGYYYFRQPQMIEQLTQLSKGTAQLNLSPIETLKQIVLLPRNDRITDFYSAVLPNHEKLLMNKRRIKSLQDLRDTLLPKLMSGQVRVKLD